MIHIKRQILVVDNDLAICQAIQIGLQDDSTDIRCMASPAEALVSYMKQDYSLAILDVQLSDTDSVGMLRAMHSTKHTPILVLTDPLHPQEIVELLHAGADTCMEKPLNMEVCAAQANALIKLYVEADINHNQHKPVVHGSELVISPRYRQVMVDGRHLALTKKEFDILHCLASRPGQIFSCEQLYDHIWGDSSAVAVDDIVRSQIKRLRKKLSQIGKDYIQTEWGVGYKFALPDC